MSSRDIFLATALFGAILAGCGGDDAEEQQASCRSRLTNEAAAAAIAKSYERGDITRAEVQSHFAPEDRIFDEQGRMVPYQELKGLTRGRFDEWRGNGPYPGEVREAIQSARSEVRRAGYPGC
jgi:hypothetical protein